MVEESILAKIETYPDATRKSFSLLKIELLKFPREDVLKWLSNVKFESDDCGVYHCLAKLKNLHKKNMDMQVRMHHHHPSIH